MKVKAIALNTIKECIRDKVFYLLLAFSLLIIGASVIIGGLSLDGKEKVIKDLGIAAIALFGILVAVTVGISTAGREIERRTVYTIFSKPVARWQFVIGKYLGLCSVLVLNLLAMTLALYVVLLLQGYNMSLSMLKGIAAIMIELALVAALAVMFSTFASSILSAALTLGVYVIGNLTTDLRQIALETKSALSNVLTALLYYVFPNFGTINIRAEAAHGLEISISRMTMITIYGLGYTTLILLIAVILFGRKEFD